MSEQNIQENEKIEDGKDTAKNRKKKLIVILSIAAVVLIAVIIYLIKRTIEVLESDTYFKISNTTRILIPAYCREIVPAQIYCIPHRRAPPK